MRTPVSRPKAEDNLGPRAALRFPCTLRQWQSFVAIAFTSRWPLAFVTSWPKISVVVPSFNQASFLNATLSSLFEQDYPELEVIVMDGGSTDGSVEIIEGYASRLHYWISEKDDGQADAIKRGFELSSGDIQAWLNSDDQYTAGALRHVADYFRSHPTADAVFGDMIWIDGDGNSLRMQREMPFVKFVWLYTYNYIPQASMFWRRELYERVGGVDTSFHLAMDSDLWARFAGVTEIHHTRRVLSKQTFYPEQKTQMASKATREREDRRALASLLSEEPALATASKRALARALRIGWRAATGCYSRNYQPNLRRAKPLK